ncbi:MAG: adenylate/guanylate cyclase domain-containing protein [Alphaproteobacteria bacterium]
MSVDLGSWLANLGLEQYESAFRDHEIDGELLLDLTSDELKEVGVGPLGHRKKILAAIAQLKASESHAGQAHLATSPIAVPDLAAVEGERRQVTVLFADLSGFTSLSNTLEAEELHTLLNHYFSLVDAAIARYGGSVDKHIGDAVMAVFGAPLAHSDDPERAARAACDIHRDLTVLSVELGRELKVHIGIASGQVIASGTGSDTHREYTVTGNSVNLASRLQDRAGPGETLISQAVYSAVSIAECESAGDIEAKGFSEPIKAWRLRRIKDEAASLQAGLFVGRQAELRQFEAIAGACLESSTGQTILIRGEAGIGKTRLLQEFAAIAQHRGFASHKGLVLDFGTGKGRDATRALLRSLLGIPPGSGKTERRAAAEQTIARGWSTPEQRVFLYDLLDLPHPPELRGLYEAMGNDTRNRQKTAVMATIIAAAARQQPRLIIIEDVHWADALILDHLAAMAATVRDAAAILVMTTRVEGDPVDESWRAANANSPLLTIDLAPLRPAEAIELASEAIQSSQRIVHNCVDRSGGNPLFLVQLLHNVEEGNEEDVPSSIQSLILARTDRLMPLDKQALQAASVIGQRFTQQEVQALLKQPDYECRRLIGMHLVGRDGDGFLFSHALVRDGVYGALLSTRARDLHQAAANYYADSDPVLRAQHLDRAGSPDAAGAYLAAARLQAATYHLDKAENLVRRGLALASDRADMWALKSLLGELQLNQGAAEGALAVYRDALDLADSPAQRTDALLGSAACMRLTDDFDDALAALDQAEQEAKNDAEPAERARIHSLRGNIFFPLGRIDDCDSEHQAALRYAKLASSPVSEAQALSGLADVAYARGRMATAFRHFRDCVDLSKSQGFGRIEVANRSMVGFARHYLVEFKEALDDADAAIETAVKVGHSRAELLGQILAFFLRLDTADYSGMEPHLERSHILVEDLGAARFEAQILFARGIMESAQGHRQQATETARASIKVCRETSFGFSGPRCLALLSSLTDDPGERQSTMAEGERMLAKGAVGHNHLFFYRLVMESALQHGEWDEVRRHAASLQAFTAQEPLPWANFFIARAHALSAVAREGKSAHNMAEIERLRAQATAWGLRSALPGLLLVES